MRASLLLGFLLVFAFVRPAFSESGFPGNPSRIAYEQGILEYLRGNPGKARSSFRDAESSGGPYGDLARMMLLRMEAHAEAPETLPDARLRGLLRGFEDERLLPLAWFAMIQALLEGGRSKEALSEALEFSLRFSDHELVDDALLVAVRILFADRDYEAALELIYRMEKQGSEIPDRMDELWLYKAKIYFAKGSHQSPPRACEALNRILVRAQNAGKTKHASPVRRQARQLELLFCR